MPDISDLIPITEAALKYKRSREWLDRQVLRHKLHKYTIPGDRKNYLSISELEQLFTPKINPASDDTSDPT